MPEARAPLASDSPARRPDRSVARARGAAAWRLVAGCSWAGSRPASRSSRWPARWARRSSASVDHRLEPLDLALDRADLAVDPVERVLQDRAPFAGVAGLAEGRPVARARRLVLEQLADLGEREPGVVAQAADEPQALEVLGVVQAVGALRARGGGEEPQLLVVADRARRQAGVGGDLLDPEQAARRRHPGWGWSGRGGSCPSLPNLTVHVKVRVRRRCRSDARGTLRCVDTATGGRGGGDVTDAARRRPRADTDRREIVQEAGRQLRAPAAAGIAGILFAVLYTAAWCCCGTRRSTPPTTPSSSRCSRAATTCGSSSAGSTWRPSLGSCSCGSSP